MNINGLPVYKINLGDDLGITCVSLVENPAMECQMICFEKEDKILKFSVDEVKHNIIYPIIRTDYPIYRFDERIGEFYVVFTKDITEEFANKLMTKGFSQIVTLNHDGNPIEGVTLQELFIKDTNKGINPKGFEDVAEGSLFGIYHISNENLWEDCLNGKFNGFSLESYLNLKEQFSKINNNKNKNKIFMKSLRNAIKNLLLQFSEVDTDKGLLTWEEDAQLEVGYSVYQDGEIAKDGEYKTDDKIFVVVDGKVAEIRDVVVPDEEGNPKVEEEMGCGKKIKAEEPEVIVEPEVVETAPVEDPRFADYEKRIAILEEKIQELVEKLAELAIAPAVPSVEETFEKTTKNIKVSKSADKYIEMFSKYRK